MRRVNAKKGLQAMRTAPNRREQSPRHTYRLTAIDYRTKKL